MKLRDSYTTNERSPLMRLTTALLFITAIGVSAYAVSARSNVSLTGPSARSESRAAPLPVRTSGNLQLKNERRFRVFVLEGITQDGYLIGTRGPIEVVRNGKVSLLRPGDEVEVGDRIRSGKGVAQTIPSEGGGFLAFYDDEGQPVAIVGDPDQLDFTVSKMGIVKRQMRVPSIEITNHRSRPLTIDIEQNSENDRPVVTVRGEDGTPQRGQTNKERDSVENRMEYPLHEERRSSRWDRAARIYELGRKGAAQDYSADEKAKKERATSEERLEREAAARKLPERQERHSQIAGKWKAGGINYEYEISQNGSTFSWQVTNQPSLNETARGEFTGKDSIKVTWTNRNGSDSATGRITSDANGNATRIDWSNGIVFNRN